MATNKLSMDDLRPAIQLVEKYLRLGYRPPGRIGQGQSAIGAAGFEAKARGWVKGEDGQSWLRRRLDSADKIGFRPDWSLWVPVQYELPVTNFRGVLDRGDAAKPEGRMVRVCVIPDVHLCHTNADDFKRMEWMGKWVQDRNPDYVVQLGDVATFDSVTRHTDPASMEARSLPSFTRDIEALADGLGLFLKGMGGRHPKMILTLGNHEDRVARFENLRPQLGDCLSRMMNDAIISHGWRTAPYGEFVFIEGVGFIHHPVNGAGKSYGGKTAMQRSANDATFSFVCGHYHTRQIGEAPKIGPNFSVRAISAGCALPYGHVEAYARHSTTGWWWGVLEVTIVDGLIIDETFTSMLTLKSRYE